MLTEHVQRWRVRAHSFSQSLPGAREYALVGVVVLCVHVAKALTMLTARDSDFIIFYVSALRARLGSSMYFVAGELFRNHNPPHFHLIVLPLTYLPPAVAWTIWTAVSVLIAIWLTLTAMRRSRRAWTSRERWILAACLLNAAGVQAALRTGQLSWLIAAPVTLAWIAAREQKWTVSAIWAGLAMSVKPFLLVLLAFYAVRRQWRALVTAVGVAALGLISGAVVFGWNSFEEWTAVLRTPPPPEFGQTFVNASIMAFVARPGSPVLLAPTVSAVLVLLAIWRARTADDDHAWALLLITAVLASPVASMYYAPLFLGPIVVLLHERRLFATRWLLLPFMFPPFAHQPFRSTVLQLSIGSIYMWGLFLLWVTLYRSAHADAVGVRRPFSSPRRGRHREASQEP